MLPTFPLLYTKLPSTALKFKYFVTSVWMRTRTKAPFAIINYKKTDEKFVFVSQMITIQDPSQSNLLFFSTLIHAQKEDNRRNYIAQQFQEPRNMNT